MESTKKNMKLTMILLLPAKILLHIAIGVYIFANTSSISGIEEAKQIGLFIMSILFYYSAEFGRFQGHRAKITLFCKLMIAISLLLNEVVFLGIKINDMKDAIQFIQFLIQLFLLTLGLYRTKNELHTLLPLTGLLIVYHLDYSLGLGVDLIFFAIIHIGISLGLISMTSINKSIRTESQEQNMKRKDKSFILRSPKNRILNSQEGSSSQIQLREQSFVDEITTDSNFSPQLKLLLNKEMHVISVEKIREGSNMKNSYLCNKFFNEHAPELVLNTQGNITFSTPLDLESIPELMNLRVSRFNENGTKNEEEEETIHALILWMHETVEDLRLMNKSERIANGIESPSIRPYFFAEGRFLELQILIRGKAQVHDFEITGIELLLGIEGPFSNPSPGSTDSTRMISLIAHEIRTPINCVISLLEGVKKPSPISNINIRDNDTRMSEISKSISLLNILLETCSSILDFLSPGKKEPKWGEFDLFSIFDDVELLFSATLKEKGLYFRREINEDVQEYIKSDPIRLRQIVINLVSNAIKYTRNGGITLRVSKRLDHIIRIAVEDTGLGIKPKDQQKLFRDFGKVQNKQDLLLNKNGVGLGLNLSNNLARLLSHDGKTGITVSSEYGKGSIFEFEFEDQFESNVFREILNARNSGELSQIGSNNIIDIQDNVSKKSGFGLNVNKRFKIDEVMQKARIMCNAKNAIMSFIEAASRCKLHPRILLVDDNEFNLKILLAHFHKLNIECTACTAPQEALDEIASRLTLDCLVCRRYELIITDYEMPFMDGFEFREEISKFKQYKNIPIVLASATDQHPPKVMRSFDMVIAKPVSAEEIQQVTGKYISNKQKSNKNNQEALKCTCANSKTTTKLTPNSHYILDAELRKGITDCESIYYDHTLHLDVHREIKPLRTVKT